VVTARRLFAAALVLVVVGVGVAGVLAWRSWSDGEDPTLQEPVVATAIVAPEQHLFADAVRARLEVVVDGNRVDPETVDVGTNFAPYRLLRPVERSRSDAGSVTKLTYEYVLGCLAARCLPDGSGRAELSGVALNYTRRGAPVADAATIEWPPLRAAGRIDPEELDEAALRAELRDLPSPTYTVSPRVVALVALLLAMGAQARLTRLRRSLQVLRGHAGEGDVLEVVTRQTAELVEQRRQLTAGRTRLEETRLDVAASLRHVGVVRHDDAGGFSAAIVDDEGAGLVITSPPAGVGGAGGGPGSHSARATVVAAGETPKSLTEQERRALQAATRGRDKN